MNIHVANLPPSITEQGIKELFAPYGVVESVKIISDKESGIFMGSAYVNMPSEVEGDQAIAGLDGIEYRGHNIRVQQADGPDFPSDEYW